ncbi:MAG: LysR family transcriptional regulator [Proteobacteria bacterium]|nr:MAG: LysR family transcriptional regulator [Pseudomonadota bacterium]
MKIPSGAMEAFLEVARTRHFTHAAQNLGLTQSALSQRILNLEKLLETTLFVRGRAGPTLTPAGEKFLSHAQTVEALEADYLGRETLGSVRVAAFSSVMRSLTLPALAPLLIDRPLPCTLLTRELGELAELLRQGEADFIITEGDGGREGVAASFLGFEENVLVKLKRRKVPEIYLDHDPLDNTTARYLQKQNKRKFERRFLNDIYGLLDGVKLGLGLAVLPRHLVKNEKDLEILEENRTLRIPVWLHYLEQPFYTKGQLEIKAALESHFRAHLPQR